MTKNKTLARTEAPRKPYTIKTAAEFLSLSTATIRRLVDKGVLRSSRITRKILIRAEDVETLVDRTSG
jgi:excisionase family DNA binding protein